MKFKRFNISEVNAERYYQLPKFLFEGEFKKSLSAEAKVLYALLRDRFTLSCKNGWANEKGEVYLIFPREEMCDMIGCGMQKIRRLISELKSVGLFEEEQVGQNMPNLIFLTYADIGAEAAPSAETGGKENENSLSETAHKNVRKAFIQADCRKSTLRKNAVSENPEITKNPKNSDSDGEIKTGLSKINTPDCRKSTPNKKNNNKTDLYNPSIYQNSCNYNCALKETKEQIEYDLLKADYPSSPYTPNIVDGITEIITEVKLASEPHIRIGSSSYLTEVFKSKLAKLTSIDIADVIERFKNLITPPSNPRAYLTAMLYNAKADNSLF